MLRALIILAVLSCPVLFYDKAHAQEDVEINLDTLDGYVPPPMMFGDPQQEIPPRPAVRGFAPLPRRKPFYDGWLLQRVRQNIDEDVLAVQTAQDVLRAIDGDVDDIEQPVARPAAVSEPPKNPPSQKRKDLSSLQFSDSFELALPFPETESSLQNSHKDLILQNIVIRLQKYEDSILEVRSYAGISDQAEGEARRIALARAVAIERFLMEKGIAERRIFLRALAGTTDKNQKDSVLLVVSRR